MHVKGWVQQAPEKVITCTRDENTGPVRVTVGAGAAMRGSDHDPVLVVRGSVDWGG